ncbi:MAG: relaxase/mobilization nuclease domain-containing protein [Hyphomicrobiaceae bacterium]
MGSSFKQRIEYLYRGPPERALFDTTQHLVSRAREAIPEMEDTSASQLRLKQAAGIRRGGRRCVKPVTHDTISWDEDERPNFDEMERAARSYLAALGLAEHQAVMVGHDHNGKRHVHIVANAVHPITGRVADRDNDQLKAQAWAHSYEVAQGRIRCRHRTAPRMDRAFVLAATGKKKSGQRLSRAAHLKMGKRRQAVAETRARHKAGQWAALTAQQQSRAANADRQAVKQKADKLPAPRP